MSAPAGLIGEVDLVGIRQGAHVAWTVVDDSKYLPTSKLLVAGATREREKLFVFGPKTSSDFQTLSAQAAVAADPRVDFLGGDFDAETMLSVFREQDQIARAEGFVGLRVVADMDWILGANPPRAAVIEFELLLDRAVREIGVTVVCAYRRSSFDAGAVLGAQAVHRFSYGDVAPPFRLSAGVDGWELSGEVDIAVEEQFADAISAAASSGPCVIDVSGLEFIDIRGMRTLARASAESKHPIRINGASSALRRYWQVAGFDDVVSLNGNGALH